ncbi:MAG: hypothetical protein HQL54_08800 [Magnetococcales bacterium]|nr:hypothetical protein [Magnetococcales bacterium]
MSAASHTNKSLFLRHWQGGFSLGRSFWLHLIVFNIILLLLFRLVTYTVQPQLGQTLFWIRIFMLLQLSSWAFTVWQVVGVWRSAIRHRIETKRLLWSTLAQAFVCFAVVLLFWQLILVGPSLYALGQVALGLGEYQTWQIKHSPENKTILIDGDIGYGIKEDLEKSLKQHPNTESIMIRSQGGYMWAGRELHRLIRNHGIKRMVAWQQCDSACTLVMLAAPERYATSDTSIRFHAPYYPVSTAMEIEREREIDRGHYAKAKLSRHFFNQAYSVAFPEFWTPSIETLIEAKYLHGIIDIPPQQQTQ